MYHPWSSGSWVVPNVLNLRFFTLRLNANYKHLMSSFTSLGYHLTYIIQALYISINWILTKDLNWWSVLFYYLMWYKYLAIGWNHIFLWIIFKNSAPYSPYGTLLHARHVCWVWMAYLPSKVEIDEIGL